MQSQQSVREDLIQVHKEGRDIMLNTKEITVEALKEVSSNHDTNDGTCTSNVAKINRDDLFSEKGNDPNFIP